MKLRQSYRFINKRLRSSYREPTLRWGIRVAVSISVPLLWGLLTENRIEAEWMAIAAECVSLFELKGTTGQRFRLLLSAALFSVFFCLFGSIAGNYLWLMLVGMLSVGFFCVLLKNLGERGTGLALSVYIFYIIGCAYPLKEVETLQMRCFWVGIGALWTMLVGLLTFLFIRTGTPYRRTIASIWEAMAGLAAATGSGWDGKGLHLSERAIYLKEKEVRDSLNDSLYLFEEMSDSVSAASPAFPMTQIRKSAAIVSLHVIQISEAALSLIDRSASKRVDRHLSLQIAGLFRALQQTGERMSEYMLTLKYQEQVLVYSRLERLEKIAGIILQSTEEADTTVKKTVEKIHLYAGRVNTIVRHALKLINENQSEKRVFQAYSFTQTLQILHPKYLQNNLKQLLNFNSRTTRYALRIGISVMVGAAIAHLFFKSHGYWITFTTIIVAQPYFGATLKKGIQRSLGTITGVVVGTAFLQIPFPVASKVILVFVSSFFLIIYLRKQYAVAAFFITLMLVGILSLEPGVGDHNTLTYLLLLRISGTLIGAAIAIAAGFLLLPLWDKDLFPKYQFDAFKTNRTYFIHTFYSNQQEDSWLRFKRLAETKNADAFDSLNRFVKEPGHRKELKNESFFYWITHNVRITRELNNFNSEWELDDAPVPITEKEKYMQLLSACDNLFRESLNLLQKRLPESERKEENPTDNYPLQGFRTRTPTEAQLIVVEKLWMELKFIHEALLQETKTHSS